MKRALGLPLALLLLACFTVSPARAAQPLLAASPTIVLPGQTLTVQGYGFTPGATVRVIALLPSFQTNYVSTNFQGFFATQFVVPFFTPSNTYTVSAQVSTFTPITTVFRVSLPNQPRLTVAPNSVEDGTWVTVSGYGFPAFQVARVATTVPKVQPRLVSTGVDGSITAPVFIPENTRTGNYRISAQIGTNTPIFTTLHVHGTETPTIEISPGIVKPNSYFTVEGINFRPRAGVRVSVLFPSLPQTHTETAGPQGDFSMRFYVPYTVRFGQCRITAQVSTYTPVTANIRVTP